jgi:hypothetical protein
VFRNFRYCVLIHKPSLLLIAHRTDRGQVSHMISVRFSVYRIHVFNAVGTRVKHSSLFPDRQSCVNGCAPRSRSSKIKRAFNSRLVRLQCPPYATYSSCRRVVRWTWRYKRTDQTEIFSFTYPICRCNDRSYGASVHHTIAR